MITEEVTGYDRFSVPISDVPSDLLQDIARKRNLNDRMLPEETEVRYWEIEAVLEDREERRDHTRSLDAAIQKAIELYDDRSYDLVMSNVEYDLKDILEEENIRKTKDHEKWYQGEIDLMLVNFEDNWVRGVEAKPRRGRPLDHNNEPVYQAPRHEDKVEEQYERHAFAFDLLNENLDDFNMHYIPEEPIFEPELSPEMEVPDSWEGSHYWDEESMRKTFESETAIAFLDKLVLPENPMIVAPENEYERQEIDRGDFLKDFSY